MMGYHRDQIILNTKTVKGLCGLPVTMPLIDMMVKQSKYLTKKNILMLALYFSKDME
jgi:hypothetical protein